MVTFVVRNIWGYVLRVFMSVFFDFNFDIIRVKVCFRWLLVLLFNSFKVWMIGFLFFKSWVNDLYKCFIEWLEICCTKCGFGFVGDGFWGVLIGISVCCLWVFYLVNIMLYDRYFWLFLVCSKLYFG